MQTEILAGISHKSLVFEVDAGVRDSIWMSSA